MMRPGKIVVICGPMFSEKSLRLISLIQRALNAGKKVQAFRPDVPGRPTLEGDDSRVVSRFGASYPATTLKSFEGFFEKVLEPDTGLVAITEAQFFGPDIVDTVRELRRRGIDVAIEGLDLDAFENPFGYMPQLLALAQEVIKTTAVCRDCGEEAQISYRLTDSTEQVAIGDQEYVPLCYKDYYARRGINADGYAASHSRKAVSA